jgi:hypothetical protein
MKLNLPEYSFNIRRGEVKQEIFDSFRGKYVSLTPEEWVRQNFIKYLIEEKKYPASLIAIEKGLVVNGKQRRFDAVAFDNTGTPMVLMEFKSVNVKIDQKVFEQIAVYNQMLKVKYLIVSNGLKHYCCKIDFSSQSISFLENIPEFYLLK